MLWIIYEPSVCKDEYYVCSPIYMKLNSVRNTKEKEMTIIRKSSFKSILLLVQLCIIISCSEKKPTSPPIEDVIDISKISFSVDVEDPIPTAFLNSFAKLFSQNERGVVEVKIINENNLPVQLKLSVKIEQYTDETTKTLTIAATDSQTINVNPLISDEKFNTLNENKTVNFSVKAILINEETDKEIFNQTYTRQMLAKDVMVWGDDGEFLSFLVLWVTPHAPKVEELISKSVKYHPYQRLVGYQGSESEDGYAERLEQYSGTIEIPPGEEKIAREIYIDAFNKSHVISGNFSATGGLDNSIIARLVSGDGNILYDSGYIEHGSFSGSISKSGYYYYKFDNTSSWWFSRTVSYNLTLSYYEDIITPQVKAIYLALQNDYNIKYVSSTISFPDEGTQRIRFPNDALTLGSANCIDGTVLFASALENIDLEPLIVLIPGHAFVGWRRWTGSNIAEFLETTMISNSSFKEAYNEGLKKYNENYKDPDTKVIDIKKARDMGLTPLMKPLDIP